MIADLKPYSAMKDSGVEWLGEVPEHWEVRRLKTLFREVDERTASGEETLLSLRMHEGLVPHEKVSDKPISANALIGYKKVKPGQQLVMNRMRAAIGVFGVPTQAGLVSPDYAIFDPAEEAELAYFLRLFKSSSACGEFRVASKGLGTGSSGFMRLYTDQFGTVRAPLPPPAEQAAIVRYLDHVDRRVRRLARAKRKLIVLLKEQKQAIIHRVVTRGLDPNVPLKDSGVEWLGEVPKHWQLRRLRSLAHITTGGRDTVDRVDDGQYPFFVRSQEVERINSWSFDGEAVLTAGDGAGVAKVFHYVNGRFDYHQRVYKFSGFRDVLGGFFFEYFRATLRFEALAGDAKSTVDSLRRPLLQNFPVAVPPPEEQVAIVDCIRATGAPIEDAIRQAQREIDLLNEYHTRLIADLVTGKLDVRDAAAALPDVDPPGADDDLDESLATITQAELDDLDSIPEEVEV